MGPAHLWALVCCLAILGFSVQPGYCQATIQVAADRAAIQTVLDGLPDTNSAGVTLEIAEGTADFGTTALVINKLGVSLKGAGIGKTIFQTDQVLANPNNQCFSPTADGLPLLILCRPANNNNVALTTMPTIIEGITFKNSNPSFITAGAEKGIGELTHADCFFPQCCLRQPGGPTIQLAVPISSTHFAMPDIRPVQPVVSFCMWLHPVAGQLASH